MATDKKSFILYCDLIHTVNKLPDETAGKLLKHILAYVNDLNPETDDLLVEVAFEPIKQAMKRDLKKWETEIDRKSQGAILGNLKRWHTDLYEKVQANEITIDEAQTIAKGRIPSHTDKSDSIATKSIASIAVSVNDSVNDSVSVNDTDINNKPQTPKGDSHLYDNFESNLERLLHQINHAFGKKYQKISDKVKAKYKVLLKSHQWVDVKAAIDAVKDDKFHIDSGYKYATPEFFSRPDKIDMYGFKSEIEKKYTGENALLVNNMEKYLKAGQS